MCSTDFSVMSGLRWPFRVEAKSYHGCAGLHLPPIPRVARG
ncbi:hypothetical protein phi297_00031 [Pseudomonas phage phi297]|nr:hypothetical protein phi297_00031 [Pseudomonas phage phi297]AEX55833.1 hypothetical protein phi297_00031 [Pseudomonas phage phi297]